MYGSQADWNIAQMLLFLDDVDDACASIRYSTAPL